MAETLTIHAKAFLCSEDLDPEDAKKMSSKSRGELVQTASEESASNEFFVEMLAAQTYRAKESLSLLAKTPEMDLLLRLAGTTQISKAIRERGSKAGKPFILILAGVKEPRVAPPFPGTELPRRGLTKSELLRVERAALLSARRG